MKHPIPLLLILLLLSSCANSRSLWRSVTGQKVKRAEDVPAAIEDARGLLDEGRTGAAIRLLREARDVPGTEPETRQELEQLLERAAQMRVVELTGTEEENPGALGEILDLELPRQISVSAAVQAARQELEAGHPKKAWKLIQKIDRKYPLHHERAAAGAVLYEAGGAMVEESKTFLGLFSNHDEGLQALEYLVVNYPSQPSCDEALRILARTYEKNGDLRTALERHEDLLTWHSLSPHATASEAAMPRLRLALLESPEYDRDQLARARAELEAWIEHHPGHELEERVRSDYADCLERLCLSDLSIARFYRRVDNGYGARYHARRALEEARLLDDERLVTRAREALEKAAPPEASTGAAETPAGRPEGGS